MAKKVLSKLVTQTSAQMEDVNGKQYPLLQSAGAKIFVQSTAPSSGMVDGDIWIQIP